MQKLFVITLSILLASCSLFFDNPEDKFNQGDYSGGIKILAQNYNAKSERLKKKNKEWKQKDVDYLKNTVTKVSQMAQKNIDQAHAQNYDEKIRNYKLLLTMQQKLSGRGYSNFIEDFLKQYPEENLKQSIAAQYYDKADNIVVGNSQDYLRKAKEYREGIKYFNYKDIAKRAEESQNLYYTTAAEEFYRAAQNDVKNQNYKQAVINFQKAQQVYKPLGNYKDSVKQAAFYEKKWRTLEAQANYQMGKTVSQKAKLFKDHRLAASYFNSAVEVYRQYGPYLDAAQLASSHYRQGRIKIYIDAESVYSENIRRELREWYIDFVSSPEQANLVINLTTKKDYQQKRDNVQSMTRHDNIKVGTEKVDDGQGNMVDRPVMKNIAFTEYCQKTVNRSTIKATVRMKGLYYLNKDYYGKSLSSETRCWFDRKAPAKYKPYTKNSLLSQAKLEGQAREDLWSNIKDEIKYVSSELSKM